MPKSATARKPAAARAASNVVAFEFLNETPGALRYQEHDADGTPLVNDGDGARIGALYIRKAQAKSLGIDAANPPKRITLTIACE